MCALSVASELLHLCNCQLHQSYGICAYCQLHPSYGMCVLSVASHQYFAHCSVRILVSFLTGMRLLALERISHYVGPEGQLACVSS